MHADLAMHATLAALGTLPRSMSLWALGPVGDMQAVSYGARSRQYSPLIPASLLFWSRLVHADLAIHATLAALGTLPRSMSL